MNVKKILMGFVTATFMPLAVADYFDAGDISIEVIDTHGRELAQYWADGSRYRRHSDTTVRSYLEAKPGQAYAIRVHNHSNERIAMVIAVDGRNIITGKHSKLKSKEKKYVLGPYQSAVYRGWRTGKNRVNEFYFTDQDNSYSAAFGDYSAMGVIAIAVFRDKDRYRYEQYHDNDDYYSKSERSPTAPSADSSLSREKSRPGTGYGDDIYSRSRRVQFDAEHYASAKILIKYEWEETLCTKGIKPCYTYDNRFWPDDKPRRYYDGRSVYAPPPPNRYRYQHDF